MGKRRTTPRLIPNLVGSGTAVFEELVSTQPLCHLCFSRDFPTAFPPVRKGYGVGRGDKTFVNEPAEALETLLDEADRMRCITLCPQVLCLLVTSATCIPQGKCMDLSGYRSSSREFRVQGSE